MARALVPISLWASLGCCVIVGTAWLWSYSNAWYVDRGRLLLVCGDLEDADALRSGPNGRSRPAGGWYDLRDNCQANGGLYTTAWGGLGYGSCLWTNGVLRIVAVPLWMVGTLPAASAVTLGVLHRRATRRALGGRCVRCGYDLRGSPDRCPECGTVP